MNQALIKNVIYPAYRLFRYSDTSKRLKELEGNQWLSRQELQDLQWRKLKDLLKYVFNNVPYYTHVFNEFGLKPDNIHDAGDFMKIPVLTKDIIRKNKKLLITTDASRKGSPSNTGGSTGETLNFFMDMKAGSYIKANLIRVNKWLGIDIGDREAVFWGTPFDMSKSREFADGIRRYFQNIIHLSTFDMSEKKMLHYAGVLQGFKPSLLHGYPSALYIFANFLKKNNITDIKPRAIISTGEKSYSFQKEVMEEIFGCKVYERYGSNEFATVAQECPDHHDMHILSDMNYIELLKDNRPVEKGETGEIIVTNLHNYYMPFLRYKIGDLGILSDALCSCGRGFPMMEAVEGRSFDMIVTPSGKTLGGFFWTYMSRAVPGIKRFQIIQKNINKVEFKIVPDSSFEKGSINILEDKIREQCGRDFKVDFNIVKDIALTRTGKFRFIISDLPKERLVMKSKIHKATITDVRMNHIDSISIDEDLMKMVNLREYERVLVVNNNNGARMETHVIKGKKGSGNVSMNGATAHLVNKGDEIIVMAFTWTDEEIIPKTILVDSENKFVKYLVKFLEGGGEE